MTIKGKQIKHKVTNDDITWGQRINWFKYNEHSLCLTMYYKKTFICYTKKNIYRTIFFIFLKSYCIHIRTRQGIYGQI